MFGIGEDYPGRADFRHFGGIHHGHPVGHFGHHADVMGDEQDGQAELFLELPEQVEEFGLDDHVQRGGRFVGDDEFGPQRQGQGDHDPLAHAAGHLVRIFLEALLPDPQPLDQFFGPGARGGIEIFGSWVWMVSVR